MLNAQDSRNDSSCSIRLARAGAVVLGLAVMGYAFSTQGVSALEASMPGTPAALAVQQEAAPTAYFPAQYVNQGKEIGEPIPTF